MFMLINPFVSLRLPSRALRLVVVLGLAASVPQKGGERAYGGCLGEDRSPRHSRRSIASAK